MRPVGLLLIAVALMAPGCGGVRWLWSSPRTDLDLSGRWSGTWRGHVMGIARTDDATADLVQQGARGTGRLTLHTTGAVLGVPVALRNAGLTGVRVQFDVSRNDVVMRHELGGSVFRADFKVEGDRMVGYIRDADPPVRIVLTRVRPPAPVVAAPAPPPASRPAPAPAPVAPEPPTAPPSVAAAPPPPPAPMPAEPGRPAPKEFSEIAEVKPIYFDFDKYNIRPDDAKILEANAEWLKTNAEALVLIEGHCDQRGTAEYNLALGERRARAARDHFISSGISAERISIVSLGAEQPVCTEETEACWAKNRRANFLVKQR